MHVAVVIPALDEQASIGVVVEELRAALEGSSVLPGRALRCTVVVGDNGSRDQTADVARAAGAVVVHAARRGYGSACLAALAGLPADVDVVLFADGDGADHPADALALLRPLARGDAELAIGSRTLGERLGLVEPGALTAPQRFGNALATTLLRVLFGTHFSDLGPYRAITLKALRSLEMDDRDFGWTVQMQARAATRGVRVCDVPVRYRRRRAGRSKISGDLRGSAMAGVVILRTVFLEAARSITVAQLRPDGGEEPGRGPRTEASFP